MSDGLTEGQVAPAEGDVPLLAARDLWKAFGATQALRGVSLTIAPGEIHGLCGQNGAGKSTLVKILTGLVRPDQGAISFQGREVRFARPADAQAAGIAVVDQELSVVPALTVAENVRLGAQDTPFFVRKRKADANVTAILERVGIGDIRPDTRLETLSMPLRQLVEIARLLDRNAQLLILDEPTASLSRGDSLIVFAALRELVSRGHSVLYVSHRLDEVLDLCDKITVLRDGQLVAMHEIAEINHQKLVRLIVGEDGTRAMAEGAANAAHRSNRATHAGHEREIVIERVSLPPALTSFSYRIQPGEVVGLAGQVGSGATEILRSLGGLEPDALVDVTCDGKALRLRKPADAIAAGIYFVSNDRQTEGLFLSRSIETNLVGTRLRLLSKLGFVRTGKARRLAASLAERVVVRGARLSADAADLSGGNQQKVFIGRTLDASRNRLLLLDEPTRGVDVGGRAEIHNLIRNACAEGTSVVFSSGESDEVLALADTIITLKAGEVVAVHARAEMTEESLLAETTGTVGPAEVSVGV